MRPATHLRPWQITAALVAAALFLSACSSSDKTAEPPPTSAGTGVATAPATPSPGGTRADPTPTNTSAAAPTATAEGEAEAVIAAATSALDARYVNPLTRDACVADNPSGQICIALMSDESTLAGGIARFDAGDPNGGPFSFFMGRDANGAWQYWFGTQQQSYVLQQVPGELLACGTDDAATVYAQPSTDAESLASVEDGTSMRADEFLLTAPGQFGAEGARGEAWYRISAPSDGWVNARDTTDAALGDCLLHDAIEQIAHG